MECRELHTHAHDYIDGHCIPAVYQEISSHLQSCSICAEYVNSLQLLRKTLGDFPVPVKTVDQWDSMEQSILAEISSIKNSPRRFIPAVSGRAFAAAASLVLAFVSIYFIIRNYDLRQGCVAGQSFPTILDVHGEVRKNGQAYEVSEKDRIVVAGEELTTSSGSKVLLKSDSRSTLEIGENSKVVIKSYSANNQTYVLEHGALDVEVGKRAAGQLFVIKTPNAVCEVVGTKFSVDVKTIDRGLQTRLSVSEGCVKLKNSGGDSIFVKSGTLQGITDDQFDAVDIRNQVVHEPVDRFASHSSPGNSIGKKTVPVSRDDSEKSSGSKAKIGAVQSELLKATTLFESGKSDEALAIIETIVASNSLSKDVQYDTYMRKAQFLKMLKSFTDACRVYEEIVDGDFKKEQKGNALYRIAVIKAIDLNDPNGAIDVYWRYINEFENGLMIPEAYYALGELYHSKKQFAEEVKVYKEFIEKFGDLAGIERAIYTLAQLFSTEMDDCTRAVGMFTHLENKYPEGQYAQDALFWKANCLQSEGKAVQAIEAYRKYILKYPDGRWVAQARERTAGSETAGRSR